MLPNFDVLGVRVHAVQMSDAIAQVRCWIQNRETGRYVAVTGMHGVAESRQDDYFREILNTADLVVPDGMPLVWLGRWHRYGLRQRVTGSELMQPFCRETGPLCRHFFYGMASWWREPTLLRFARSQRKRTGKSPRVSMKPPPMSSGWV